MASRGRDLELSIISKAEQFDLEKPADELDALGEKADGSAKKIDAAFDRISSSTKSSMRKVDDDLTRGKRGLDEFKDEANSTARESAASFSGSFEDVADTIQETAANAFAGFGPIGAAAGLAAAAGLGTLLAKFQEAKEKAAELRKEFTALMIEGNGKIESGALFDRIKDMADDGSLAEVAQQAKDAAINTRDWVRAMAGDQDALERVNRSLAERIALLEADDTANFQQIDRLKARKAQTEELLTVLGYAAEAEDLYAGSVDHTGTAIAAGNKALEEHAATAERITGALKGSVSEVADAGDEIDALVDKAEKGGKLTLTALTKTLAEQTKAAKNHQKNLQKAMDEGGADFAEFMSSLPAEAAAAYVAASPKERAAFRKAARENMGIPLGQGVVEGVDSRRDEATAAGARTRAAVRRGVTGDGPIPVTVRVLPVGQATLSSIRAGIQLGLSGITVPVKPRLEPGRDYP